MLKEKVFQLIRLHVEEYAEGVEINENTSLIDDLRMDALDTVELIIKLEKNFGVKIPEELEDATHVRDLLDFLEGAEGLTIPDEAIKYDISVDNDYLDDVKDSLENDELRILEEHDLPDFGTLLIIEGTIEEIKDWCMWNEFDFSELNIRK